MNCGFEDVRVLSTLMDHFLASPSPLVPSPLPFSSSRPPLTSSPTASPLANALAAYTTLRAPSLLAIQSLAASNYSEMASSVLNPLYLIRRSLDSALSAVFRLLPAPATSSPGQGGTWESLYRMTTFRFGLSYEEVMRRRKWQQRVLEVGAGLTVASVGLAATLGWQRWGDKLRR